MKQYDHIGGGGNAILSSYHLEAYYHACPNAKICLSVCQCMFGARKWDGYMKLKIKNT